MKKNSLLIALLSCVFLQTSYKKNEEKKVIQKVKKEATYKTNLDTKNFQTLIDGKEVHLYWIENENIKVAFTNYGGRIVSLLVKDTKDKFVDVAVGMKSITDYKNSTEPYFGATIGRVGNRNAKGKFTLNGKRHTIPINNGKNTLHGGPKGYQDVVWEANKTDKKTIVFIYLSPDMEMGFPGNLSVRVTYSVTTDNELKMEHEASTDKPKVVNLTNHAFFNLNGEGNGTILNHIVQFNANKYTPVDSSLIPTGKIATVTATPFDFIVPHTIGERIETKNKQLENGSGYDHNFVLSEKKANGMYTVGSVIGDKSRIIMTVETKEPGIQFYSGNFMKSKNTFKSGAKDDFRTAFALETQHFPDAPNQPNFPSITLNPDSTYHTKSIYKFSHQ
jgi:aldose 1-epimerase